MIIIPAIYLSRGLAVSLYKGDPSQATILSCDPLDSARQFEKQGATSIHLVDLDATDGASEENQKIAKSLAQKTDLKVSYTDGISSLEQIKKLLDAGIAYVSLSQFTENLVEEALKRFGSEKIIFTIIAQRNVVEGRPDLEVFHYGKDLQDKGISTIIFRDTKAEGTLHPNFDEVERLIFGCSAKILAFNGIGCMDDIEIMKKTGAAGVIISRAFFENKLSLQECVRRFK